MVSGQLRVGGMGTIAGFDMPAVMVMADRLGHDLEAVAILMPQVERGLRLALSKKEEE